MKVVILALGLGSLAFGAYAVFSVRRFIEKQYESPKGWATAVEYER